MNNFINRKDIARLLSHLKISVKQVERNECKWGLDQCRKNINGRVVVYDEIKAKKILTALGML